jgi:hypothetical protein
MFKILSRGRRHAQATGTTSRVSGLNAIRPNSTAPHPIRPAFMPDTAQDQTRDYSGPRVDEISGSK